MLEQEAEWIGERLSVLATAALSPCINLGSSDRRFRERTQPYIDARVFAPLCTRGVEVVHCDRKTADGVDHVGDIFDDADLARLTALRPRLVICSNVHEHVADPAELGRRCLAMLPVGGHLLVTVPHSYPFHRDPIDTMYRPDPAELCALHLGTEVVEEALVVAGTYGDSLRRAPLRVFGDLLEAVTVWRSTGALTQWRMRWLRRPYSVSCVLLRKSA